MSGPAGTPGDSTVLETKRTVQRPKLFKVLLHNDHYTTMEFVVDVLMIVFGKSEQEAFEIMLNVHRQGIGIAGVYAYAVAETKIAKVHSMAKDEGYPLRCSMEPE